VAFSELLPPPPKKKKVLKTQRILLPSVPHIIFINLCPRPTMVQFQLQINLRGAVLQMVFGKYPGLRFEV
jgi:hypothetical protein